MLSWRNATIVALVVVPLITLAAFLIAPPRGTFPLRASALPKELDIEEIDIYRMEKGTVHVLAWEKIELVCKERRSKTISTQILVLKRFEKPQERGDQWALALLHHAPMDKDRPWQTHMAYCTPSFFGGENPSMACELGFQFYKDLPTNQQLCDFLIDSRWKPIQAEGEIYGNDDDGKFTKLEYKMTVISGGVDRELWEGVFGRDVPTQLFPELKRPTMYEEMKEAIAAIGRR